MTWMVWSTTILRNPRIHRLCFAGQCLIACEIPNTSQGHPSTLMRWCLNLANKKTHSTWSSDIWFISVYIYISWIYIYIYYGYIYIYVILYIYMIYYIIYILEMYRTCLVYMEYPHDFLRAPTARETEALLTRPAMETPRSGWAMTGDAPWEVLEWWKHAVNLWKSMEHLW